MANLSDNAKKVFKDLYSFIDESIDESFKRVANEFGSNEEETKLAYTLQRDNIWRPNTPVYLNAGTNHKIFSACYVVGLDDSMNSIYDIANVSRKIFGYGAGVGIPIGNLREKEASIFDGEPDTAPEGKSSGPITFMKLYDAVGETTKSGGRVRRAAIMCSMQCWHPDVMDFITSKEVDGTYSSMNISVTFTDKFMEHLDDNVPFPLVTPYDGSQASTIKPKEMWNKLVEMAHKTGDPGVIFIDTVNKFNPLKKKLLIECCNPCGEQFLQPFNCCNLSAINVSKFVKDGEIDYKGIYDTAYQVAKLMDNVIDVMDYPDPRFEKNTKRYRPIGIGFMGLADLFYMLDIKYDGAIGKRTAGKIMRTITCGALNASADMAEEKGKFHDYEVFKDDVEDIMFQHISGHWDEEVLKDKIRKHGVRNCAVTTVMPTGCLTGNSLISSNKGVKKIKDYKDVQFNKIKTVSDTDICTFKNWYDQGFAKTKKVITRRGYEIEGTYDHKLRVIENGEYVWKRIDEIEECDNVVLKKGFLTDIDGVDKLTSSQSELIGYFMADGWIQKPYRFYLSVNYKDKEYIYNLLDKFKNDTQIDFNIKERESGTYGDSFKIDISSKNFIDWFEKNGIEKNGSHNANIPDVVLESSRDIILSFLKGLYKGDGCILSRENSIVLTTVSKVLSNQVQSILLGLGYPSFVSFYPVSKGDTIEIGNRIVNKNHDIYKLKINNYYSSIFGNEIELKIERTSKNMYEIIPILKDEKIDIRYNNKNGLKYISENKAIENNIDTWFIKNNLFIDKVKKVVDTGINAVYDMEIKEDGHTYIANGFITHNTTALSCDASYGMEPCFGLVFKKHLVDGSEMDIANPIFRDRFQDEEWYTEDLLKKIRKNNGSLKGIHGIPKRVRETFVTAHDIKWRDRIDVQSSIQKHCSNAISSTINLSKDTPVSEVDELYRYAYEKGLKGVTIYRDGSKKSQPVSFNDGEKVTVEDFDRPSKLAARVHKLDTGNGKMYVTVSSYDSKPIEVFLHVGKSGQVVNTFSEALGRVISIALQNGVSIENIVKTLIGINSDKPTWTRFDESEGKMTQILSVPDGLAQLLKKFYSGKEQKDTEISGEICPKCGTSFLINIEGCSTCSDCGYSACA